MLKNILLSVAWEVEVHRRAMEEDIDKTAFSGGYSCIEKMYPPTGSVGQRRFRLLDHVDELIESTQETDTTTSETPNDSMKNWIGWALALSLVLHIGAAVVLIVMGESSIGGDNSSRFIIQDVVLTPTPTISAPVTPEPVPSEEQQAAVTAPPPTETGGAPLPAEEPVPATPPTAVPESAEKAGGPMSTPLGLGMAHGYFSSLADGKSLRDDIRDYYLEMVQGINRAWWDKAVQLKEPLRQDAVFEVKIKRDGTIVGVQIVNGTGSRSVDHMLVDIIMKASPLPALPATFTQALFSAPLRIRAPSFFFRLSEGLGGAAR